jgi:hypothetical protein
MNKRKNEMKTEDGRGRNEVKDGEREEQRGKLM